MSFTIQSGSATATLMPDGYTWLSTDPVFGEACNIATQLVLPSLMAASPFKREDVTKAVAKEVAAKVIEREEPPPYTPGLIY